MFEEALQYWVEEMAAVQKTAAVGAGRGVGGNGTSLPVQHLPRLSRSLYFFLGGGESGGIESEPSND